MKIDNYTDHVGKKMGRISEIRWLVPKRAARKYPFKLTTRYQLSGAHAAAQSQQHCELLPKAAETYHQAGQKHDRLPVNLRLREPGRGFCQRRGGEGLKFFEEPATSQRAGGEGGVGGRFDSPDTRPRSRELIETGARAAFLPPRSRSPPILRGQLPFTLPGAPARGSQPRSRSPAPAAARGRPRRQGRP